MKTHFQSSKVQENNIFSWKFTSFWLKIVLLLIFSHVRAFQPYFHYPPNKQYMSEKLSKFSWKNVIFLPFRRFKMCFHQLKMFSTYSGTSNWPETNRKWWNNVRFWTCKKRSDFWPFWADYWGGVVGNPLITMVFFWKLYRVCSKL